MDFDRKRWVQDMIRPGRKRPLPVLSFPGIQITGHTVEETVRSGNLQAECMKAVADRFDMAAVLGLMDLSVEAEAFGSPVRYSSQEVPTVTAAIIQEEEEAEALQVPEVGAAGTSPGCGKDKKMEEVKVWQEDVHIPTYEPGEPQKNPMFLEGRVYQGSSGKVYPYPVTEKISYEKTDHVYRAVFLENQYLKVMVLPELGGRIQRAYDKTNGYDFVYYNHVIKPALVGLTGPWISGGIEFNWPQHHRPTTCLPVDWKMEKQADGSASVLVSDVDQMYGTKGMARFTLYPPGADLSGEFRRGAPGRNQGQSPLVSPGPGRKRTGA